MTDIWSYLSSGPLFWLSVTISAYLSADWFHRWTGRKPWSNPILGGIALLCAVLVLTGTPYQTYFQGAQFVHFLLGPATVCLALPLYQNLPQVKRAALPMIAALVAGSVTAMVSALAVGWALGIRGEVLASLAPKSATAPVAIGIAEKLGGLPTLAGALVLMTGVIGAIVVTPMFNRLGLTDWRARGFAAGLAAHGVGTARALQINDTAGAFAGIGMGLNAVLTGILAPIILHLFQ